MPQPFSPLPAWSLAYADLIRRWESHGFTPATSSNFSGRNATSDGFWVSRSGVDKADFVAGDFIPVDTHGNPLTADTPSAETLLHAIIYQQLPQAMYVAHTHSPKLTVLSRLWLEHRQLTQWAFTGYELQKAFEGQTSHEQRLCVPLWPNSQQMPDIGHALSPWLTHWQPQDYAPGFIIAGHGLYTWANTLPALKRHVTTFEFLAACTLDCWHYGHDFSTQT